MYTTTMYQTQTSLKSAPKWKYQNIISSAVTHLLTNALIY